MSVIRTLHGAGNARPFCAPTSGLPLDAIEADAWVVGGRVVLQHERPLAPLPLALHRRGFRRVPQSTTLEKLFAAVDRGHALVLDVRAWFGDPAPEIFTALASLPAPATSISFTCERWAIADSLRAWLPAHRTAYSIRSELQLRRFVEGRTAGSIPEVPLAVRHTLLHDAGEIAALHRFTPRISAWTVDEVARAQALAAWGVDEIVSNRIEVLAAL